MLPGRHQAEGQFRAEAAVPGHDGSPEIQRGQQRVHQPARPGQHRGDLRSDPFERSQHESGDYVRWAVDHAFVGIDGRTKGSITVQLARSDTTLQLAWVLGGFVGIAMPLDPPQLGLGVAAAVGGVAVTQPASISASLGPAFRAKSSAACMI